MNLKILQWNVWFEENPDNIVKEIQRINPDVICAQEFIQYFPNNIDTAKYLAQKLNYHYFFKEAVTWDNRPDKNTQGNAIFSKSPLINQKYIYVQDFQHNPPDSSHEDRLYMEAGINLNNKLLQFGTTHLSFTPYLEITDLRKKETDKLVEILSKKKNNFIFTGDLNAAPDSYVVEKISTYLKNAGPDFNEKSWTTKPFNKRGFVENDLSWRLDYIFATEDIKINSAQIINTIYSDHLPILVIIEV